MPAVSLSPIFNGYQAFSSAGLPLAFGTIETYIAGTSTPLATYTTAAGNIANANPITLLIDGRPPQEIWLIQGNAYRFVLKDFLGNQIGTYEDIQGIENAGAAANVLALLANTASTGDGDARIGTRYETAVSAVGLNLHSYIEDDGAYNVMGFIADGLKAAIRNNTSTTDLDTQINAALAAAYADNKPGLRFPRGRFNVNAGVGQVLSGNRLTDGFTVRGAGPNQTYIRQTGSPVDALFSIASPTPTVSTTTGPIELSHFTLLGNGKTCNGLLLNSVANFHIHHIISDGFTQALDLRSALIGVIELNHLSASNVGLRTRLNGTSSYCNSIRISNNEIKFNSSFGMDLGATNQAYVYQNDMEFNGTAANTATGNIMIRDTCDDEVGFAQIHLIENWMEQNLGRCIQVENMSPNFFDLIIRGGHCVGQEGGRVLTTNGMRRLRISDFQAPSATDTADITAAQLLVENTYLAVINEVSVGTAVYTNVSTVAADYISGRTGFFVASLTGCTTVPTGNITWTRQGKTVTLNIPNITGTSNTTAATLTGMPASLWPSANRSQMGVCRNNGVDAISQIVVLSTGDIVLNNGLAIFTAAGVKGSQLSTITYEI